MYFQNKLIELSQSYAPQFQSIVDEFLKKSKGNDSSFADWDAQRAIVEKKLAAELESIPSPYIKKLVSKAVAHHKNDKVYPECKYDRFCYFLDRASSEKVTNRILKYNPSYCKEIADTIALEYWKIIAYLKDSAAEMKKKNSKEFAAATISTAGLWSKMESHELKAIINDEYNAVIHEVESKVYSD